MDGDQNIYIDTFYVQSVLWGRDDEKQLADETMQKIKKTISNPNIHVKIPMIVIGEVINNLMRKFEITEILNDSTPDKLCELINDLKADLVPPRKESIESAHVLLTKDNRLRPADAMIVSQAVRDPDSTYLITNDTIVLESDAIREYLKTDEIEKTRRQKLNITEKF